ncbi:MAG: hypothetical protein AAF074_00810 [Pseudomonadota bacterium]
MTLYRTPSTGSDRLQRYSAIDRRTGPQDAAAPVQALHRRQRPLEEPRRTEQFLRIDRGQSA